MISAETPFIPATAISLHRDRGEALGALGCDVDLLEQILFDLTARQFHSNDFTILIQNAQEPNKAWAVIDGVVEGKPASLLLNAYLDLAADTPQQAEANFSGMEAVFVVKAPFLWQWGTA